MSASLAVAYIDATKHVITAQSLQDNPGDSVDETELVRQIASPSLEVRGVTAVLPPPDPGVPVDFEIDADEFKAEIVDFIDGVLRDPRAYYVEDSDLKLLAADDTAAVVLHSNNLDVTLNTEVGEETVMWAQITKGTETLAKMGTIPKDKDVGEIRWSSSLSGSLGDEYTVLLLVAGFEPTAKLLPIT
jgi:hypothetical protein